jgi:hypothetical protein
MVENIPGIIVQAMFLIFLIELVCRLAKKPGTAVVVRTLGIGICIFSVLFIVFTAKRPPLFGPFEAGSYIILILLLLSAGNRRNTFFLINASVILGILALQFAHPLGMNEDYYMYNNIWVILFFNLRLTAAGFFVHGAVLHLSYFFESPDQAKTSEAGTSEAGATKTIPADTGAVLKQARVRTLTGAVVYLCSEWSGSLWCLNWFGDSWQWSNGFFKASLLFLLVMLTCHLPPVPGRKRLFRTILGSCPGIFALWMIFFH